jgi:hypothetical protein
MYSTCTFCHAPLGANAVIEQFPVGKRLAFDAQRGRLWVVCPACRVWNLSPIEERWEAIEAAERLYRDTPRRVATEQVGLAKLRDGTELIRIGAPLRPEFAAWRYGERFTARYRKQVIYGGVGLAAVVGTYTAGFALGLGIIGMSSLPLNLVNLGKSAYRAKKVIGRFEDAEGPLNVTANHIGGARFVVTPDSPSGWGMSVRGIRANVEPGKLGRSTGFSDPKFLLTGENAMLAARTLLPAINEGGGRRATVADAVRIVERTPGERFDPIRLAKANGASSSGGAQSWELGEISVPLRLAMEMAAHEELERRALEGELAELEAQWREADEIAAIADALTLPERVLRKLERLTDGR